MTESTERALTGTCQKEVDFIMIHLKNRRFLSARQRLSHWSTIPTQITWSLEFVILLKKKKKLYKYCHFYTNIISLKCMCFLFDIFVCSHFAKSFIHSGSIQFTQKCAFKNEPIKINIQWSKTGTSRSGLLYLKLKHQKDLAKCVIHNFVLLHWTGFICEMTGVYCDFFF